MILSDILSHHELLILHGNVTIFGKIVCIHNEKNTENFTANKKVTGFCYEYRVHADKNRV